MSTNLLIGMPAYNDSTAITVTSSGTFETARPFTNLLSGGRSNLARLSSIASTFSVTFDMGSAASRTIDFFYVARANIVKAQLCTRLRLEGGTSGDIAGVSTLLQSTTLYGRDSQDAIFTSELANSEVGSLSSTATNSTYVVTIGRGGIDPATKWALSKLMFGQWFDFGRDPVSARWSEEVKPGKRSSCTIFTFTWQGISKTIKDSAISSLIKTREKGCILYTRDYHRPLLERRVVHAFIEDYETIFRSEGTYDMTIRFREQI